MTIFFWIMFALIGVVAVIDWKYKSVPSIFLTAMLFATIFIEQKVFFSILAFVFAYLLYESDYFGGVADVKVMTIIGSMLTSLNYFFYFAIITMIVGIFYKGLYKYNNPRAKEVPFVPSLWIVFIILLAIGGLS